jgi:trk system potassium uptake protein TrkA
MQPLSILIIGAGKLGRESGQQLINDGHYVTIIEKDHQAAENAREIFGDRIVQGDGCDPKVLERVGIARMQVIIAVTGDDEDNLIIAELARHVFGVSYVMTRVNRPENQWLFTSHRGVDTNFCPVSMAAELIKKEIDRKAKEIQSSS